MSKRRKELRKLMFETHNLLWEVFTRCKVDVPSFCYKECDFFYECPNVRAYKVKMYQKLK